MLVGIKLHTFGEYKLQYFYRNATFIMHIHITPQALNIQYEKSYNF